MVNHFICLKLPMCLMFSCSCRLCEDDCGRANDACQLYRTYLCQRHFPSYIRRTLQGH